MTGPRRVPLLNRLFPRVVEDQNGCWIWQGCDRNRRQTTTEGSAA